jgi:hypothetical protein
MSDQEKRCAHVFESGHFQGKVCGALKGVHMSESSQGSITHTFVPSVPPVECPGCVNYGEPHLNLGEGYTHSSPQPPMAQEGEGPEVELCQTCGRDYRTGEYSKAFAQGRLSLDGRVEALTDALNLSPEGVHVVQFWVDERNDWRPKWKD